MLALCLGVLAYPAVGQEYSSTQPVLLTADEMHYDQERQVVRAHGNVEVVQGGRIVLAQEIVYDQRSGIVNAAGNVSMLEPTGDIYFAKMVELRGDLKQGVIHDFRARLSDNSLFAAAEARRIDEHTIELKKAVYSPCKICEDGSAPLWQVKADEVRHDEKNQQITYRNARVEVKGVPVAYTPYLSHATPGADRKSGLLVPRLEADSNLGFKMEQPGYVNIAPNMDATITPIFTSQEGMVMAGEFRHLTEKGQYEMAGSITHPQKRDEFGNRTQGHEMRGHIEARGNFALNPVWGLGFDAKRTTDDTYLRRYGFGNEDTLTSRAWVEGINGRMHAVAQGLSFQGLNVEDDPDTTPYVLPLASVSYESDPFWHGARWFAEGSTMVLGRKTGAQSRRVGFEGGARLPMATEGGHIFELSTRVRADAYSVEDVPGFSGGVPVEHEGTVGRAIPSLAVDWRYPLVSWTENGTLLVEPLASVILAPYGGNPQDIPNEDSQALEFSASNLFDKNRYPGWDRVETGPRANVGVRGAADLAGGHFVEGVFGQSYRLEEDRNYLPGSGLNDTVSDFVGSLGYTYRNTLDVAYRFRFEKDDLTPRRSEVNGQWNIHPFALHVDYISFKNEPTIADREEIAPALVMALNENWQVSAHVRRDLGENGGMISSGLGLAFRNECLTLLTSLNREFTRDRDIEPGTSFSFQIFLKNLNQ